MKAILKFLVLLFLFLIFGDNFAQKKLIINSGTVLTVRNDECNSNGAKLNVDSIYIASGSVLNVPNRNSVYYAIIFGDGTINFTCDEILNLHLKIYLQGAYR
ncbi:MAG: hypothetical protein JXA68_08605 [Ignavibacteriales bacterium]|nr:hypothetical protein [Ignavibacteriales bacterium]